MQYIVILMILILLCVFGASCRKYGTYTDIQKQLTKIAESPPPKDLDMGAMCYSVAPASDRADYVCPVCGEKTLYAIDDSADEAARQHHWQTIRALLELDGCRRLVQKIDHLDVELDESQFCKRCSPGIAFPKLGLVIRYPDRAEPHRVWDINQVGLMMLDAAEDGKLKYKGFRDDEFALKNSLSRLEELLGVELDDTEQP